MYLVKLEEYIGEIDKLPEPGESIDCDFYGSLMVRIENISSKFIITNAVNGYGENEKQRYGGNEIAIFKQINLPD